MCKSLIVAMCLLFAAATTQAAELQGADAVIKQIAAARGQVIDEPETKEPTENLQDQVKALAEQLAQAPVDEAVKTWLEWVDRVDERDSDEDEFDFYSYASQEAHSGLALLVTALPRPEAWAALREAIEARPIGEGAQAQRELALRMISHVLTRDAQAIQQDVASFAQSYDQLRRNEKRSASYLLQSLAQAVVQTAADPAVRVQLFETQLDLLTKMKDVQGRPLTVPDLLTLAGQEKAEILINQAVVLPVELSVSGSQQMKAMVRKIVLEKIDEVGVPQWELVTNLEAVELFEAMEKRFITPPDDEQDQARNPLNLKTFTRLLGRLGGSVSSDFDTSFDDYMYQEAQSYYLLSLILAGRHDEATVRIRRMSEDGESFSFVYGATNSLSDRRQYQLVYAYLRDLLQADPTLPLWQEFFSLAASAGQIEGTVQVARAALERDDIDDTNRTRLTGYLQRALLAADRVDEAMAMILQNFEDDRVDVDSALQLAQLGHLLNQPAWIDQGLERVEKLLSAADRGGPSDTYRSQRIIDLLLQLDRAEAAERIIADGLTRYLKAQQNQRDRFYSYYDGEKARQWLAMLVQVYHHAGRYADVLTLLEKAPWWGIDDLADLEDDYSGISKTVYLASATALLEAGRRDEARQIVHMLLHDNGGFDRGYELLIRIDGQRATGFLDELFARDRFEERPLIWKAHLLVQAGELDAAEQLARQAIAIDPSDGEQGKGDRMRVYAVLGDVFAARNDQQHSETYQQIMLAIRQAENADELFSAGLTLRAIGMYRDALNHFADAYCIQSRMAIQLASQGMLDEAAKYYRRAFELMPDSFGQMESHCFGCEGAFTGQLAQSLAEQVFTELIERNPRKPQLHYLLGYLRTNQQRYEQALEAYRKAVELDPDYINAWKNILALGDNVFVPVDLRDQATFSMLRLDPLGKHTYPPTSTVTDLAALWDIVAQNDVKPFARPDKLIPLTASKAQMEKLREAPREAGRWMESFTGSYYGLRDRGPTSPGDAIARHVVIAALCDIYNHAGQ